MRTDPNVTSFTHVAVTGTCRWLARFAAWLERMDPGVHRRIKGLRLVTAYGIAAALGALPAVTHGITGGRRIALLAAGFALWASVSEARHSRLESTRDLAALCLAAALGAASFALLSPVLAAVGSTGPEWILVSGAFLAGYCRRFGVLGTGVGSQVFIGQLLGYGAALGPPELGAVGASFLVAAVACIVPRLLSGPAECPPPTAQRVAVIVSGGASLSPEFVMGLQAATGSLLVVFLNSAFGLTESAWAVTACVYVVAGTADGTLDRVRRRIAGTLVGVPLGLLFLPLAAHDPLLIWIAASIAMVAYAMALPERYDIACGAFAFALVITLAAAGVHSIPLLAARAWETLLGGAVGCAAAIWLFPLRPAASLPSTSSTSSTSSTD
ncbi:FUSC family protein [Cupriavidus agavae]|uniref:Fusaric acid resistance family protein n=1 Tax=Cupriavidus agavae TaxID=1001822 RepID=A0A4Q7S0W0_9BURK|nr:FUSC family protein [Cupriavidus agavae]RZT39158.1 fusaric acid resistance family protein [Cupriavidus agavae]